jgi:SAM-dependent methyltransferase
MNNKLNSLFDIDTIIKFIHKKNKNRNHYDKSKISGYKKLIENNKIYPSVKSNYQFKNVIETYTQKNEIKYLFRLTKIINHVLYIPNFKLLFNHLIKYCDKNDSEHYQLIRDMYLDIIKTKTKTKSHNQNGGLLSQIDTIYNMLLSLNCDMQNIKSIMDIGCGNGRKLTQFGKKFNIPYNNLICADIDNWFSYSNENIKKTQLNLLKIELEGEIKYSNKNISLITLIHTIHHWNYNNADKYIQRLASLKNILDKNGYIIIMEHDIFTKYDACIIDIEHGLYECVIENKCNIFNDKFSSLYLNFIEIELLMEKSGFQLVLFQYYNAGGILNCVVPNRSYIAIYKIKN